MDMGRGIDMALVPIEMLFVGQYDVAPEIPNHFQFTPFAQMAHLFVVCRCAVFAAWRRRI